MERPVAAQALALFDTPVKSAAIGAIQDDDLCTTPHKAVESKTGDVWMDTQDKDEIDGDTAELESPVAFVANAACELVEAAGMDPVVQLASRGRSLVT